MLLEELQLVLVLAIMLAVEWEVVITTITIVRVNFLTVFHFD